MWNPYIVVPFVVWVIAQFLKFSLAALRGDINFKYLYASGGMPSVHAAVVSSLAMTAFWVDGAHSSIFGLTVILAGIVMYDSFGVRRSAGEQAVAINHILHTMEQRGAQVRSQKYIREILGHKPMEVTSGAILGVFLGCLFNIDRATPLLNFLSSPVPKGFFWPFVAISAVLVIGSVVARFVLLRRYGIVPAVRQSIRRSLLVLQTFGWMGLILAGLQYENIAVASWRVWPLLMVIVFIPMLVYYLWQDYQVIPPALEQYRAELDKKKWFEGPNKKRRKAKAKKKR